MIPISKVAFGPEEEDLVLEVLRSGTIAQGPRVAELEQRFADAYEMKHVVAVNNGTTALIASLIAHEIGEGDEVITSPFTFAATLNAILDVGATPVFADIRADDFNIDSTLVESLVTPKTRAIMPVHLYGQMADMTSLAATAEKHGLVIIQDAAQAQGARHQGIAAGATHTATFSLYATKNMTTGEGGLISTDDDKVAERLRILRNQGMRARYEYVMTGYNWRLTDLQAAVGIPQIERYETNVGIRSANAAFYAEALKNSLGIILPTVRPGNEHVWHQYTLRVTDDAKVTRDEFIDQLTSQGVGSGAYYPRAVYDYEAFRNHPLVGVPHCPIAEVVASQAVSIPVHPHLTPEDLQTVAEKVLHVAGSAA